MTPEENNGWISVADRLPDTDIQHRHDYESDKVAVWTDEGLSVDSYMRYCKSTNNGHELIKEGWLNESNVTHWKYLSGPLPPAPKQD